MKSNLRGFGDDRFNSISTHNFQIYHRLVFNVGFCLHTISNM